MTAVTHRYRAFGLEIASAIPLPELPASPDAGAARDVEIRREAVDLPDGIRDWGAWYRFDESGVRFWWKLVGAFAMDAEARVLRVEPAEGVGDDIIAFPLLGPVFSEVLRRKGLFVLHANAASIDGQGVALMADKGVGKSTTGAALVGSGAQLLSDDLVAIDPATAEVRPGFGQVKLADGAAETLLTGRGYDARPQVHDKIDKTRVLLPGALAGASVPMRRLYVIERHDGPAAQVEDLPREAALQAIMRFAYAARFGHEGMSGSLAARHFRAAVAIADSVRVARLRLPAGIEKLPGVIDVLRADLARGHGPA